MSLFYVFSVVSMYFLNGGLERNSNMRCDLWDCSTIRYPPWPSNLDRNTANDRTYTVWRYVPFDGVHRNVFACRCLFGLELFRLRLCVVYVRKLILVLFTIISGLVFV